MLKSGAGWGIVGVERVLSSQESRCVFFFGQHEHTIDAKQRLAVPAAIRDVLSEETHGLVFWAAPGPNGHLWLWPEKTFQRYAANLEGSLLPNQDSMDYEQMLFSRSQRCPLDSAGRVRLPERLLDEYQLSGSVIVLGVKDHLEVVDPDGWKTLQDAKWSDPGLLERARQAHQALRKSEQGGAV
ncbi:MAG: hypothetical protein CMJ23_00260 [Phycisphaerae bacterium]|nr:hypothetical protein [Phycisphaerae bacterium]